MSNNNLELLVHCNVLINIVHVTAQMF